MQSWTHQKALLDSISAGTPLSMCGSCWPSEIPVRHQSGDFLGSPSSPGITNLNSIMWMCSILCTADMVLLTNESQRAIHDVLSLRQNLRASDNENAEISPKHSKIRCRKNKLAIISAVVWLAITTDIAKHDHHGPIPQNRP